MKSILRKGMLHLEKVKIKYQSLPTIGHLVRKAEANILFDKKSEEQMPAIKKKVQPPKIQYQEFTSYMIQFYNSISQHGRVNGQNMVFVTGATQFGKTEFINKTINVYKSKKLRNQSNVPEFGILDAPEAFENQMKQYQFGNEHSLFIRFDGKEVSELTQQAFFDVFCQKIIKQILNLNQSFVNKSQVGVLTPRRIFDICLHEYYPKYFINLFKYTLSDIINGTSMLIFQGKQGLDQFTIICEQLCQLQVYIGTQGSINPQIYRLYDQITKLLAENNQCSELEAAIFLGLQIFSKNQWDQKPEQYASMWYQTGIERTEYLFHILNYLCGFGRLNNYVVQNFIHSSSIVHQKETYIDEGNHIDVVLILQHLQNVACYGSTKFMKWLDYLIMKVYNRSNIRNHFPIVIEISNSETVFQLRKLAKFGADNPTVLEIPGYFMMNIHKTNLIALFQKKMIQKLLPVLGRSPSVWNQSMNQLKSGLTLQQLMVGQSQRFSQQQIVFHSKLNKFALFPEVLPLIDTQTLKFTVLSYLQILQKTKGVMMNDYKFYDVNLFEAPQFSPMYKLGILFEHYYYNSLTICDSRYLCGISNIRKYYMGMLSSKRKLGYKLWRWGRKSGNMGLDKGYWIWQIKYVKYWEKQIFRYNENLKIKAGFQLRYYFPSIQEPKPSYYENYIQQKYNH